MSFTTIPEMFQQTTENFPQKQLFYYKKKGEWIGLTGNDIQITVKDIAFGLKALGIEPGQMVAIMSNNSPRWAMADYGVLCSGSVTVSVYPTLIASQVEYILNDSGSKLIFVENDEQYQKAAGIMDKCPTVDSIVVMDDSYTGDAENVFNFLDFLELGSKNALDSESSFSDLVKTAKPDDLLTLIYTSGTTGTPKGVMLTHNNLVSNIKAVMNGIDFSPSDTFLSFLPLSHVFERMGGHFTSFSNGCTIYYAESIETVAENMSEVKPTLMLSVPRLYEKMYTKILEGLKTAPAVRQKIFWWSIGVGQQVSMLKLAGENLPFILGFKYKVASKLVFSKVHAKLGGRLRFFISGGAPLSQEIAEFFSSADVTILEGYGLTETSPVLSANVPDAVRFGTVGKPVYNVEIKIADDGEILAKGPNIMQGYYNDPESTAEVLSSDGWFSTGDIGEIDSDGYLKITDRKKNILVTSGGKNVAPAPLENALATSGYVDQVLVLGDKRKFISALIVPGYENVTNYLNSKGKSVSGNQGMIEHPDVLNLFENEVNNAMSGFSNYEKVKKFKLLAKPFTIEKGEITPKMSIVRKTVCKNYMEVIDSIYAEPLAEEIDDI